MKICSKCKIEKDLSLYYKDKTRKDGHDSACKTCKKEATKLKNNPPRMEGEKTCTKCGSEKAVTEFSKDKTRKDGRHPTCKVCMRENSRRHYFNNVETYTENRRRRYAENPAIFHERSNKWRRENPHKADAIAKKARENHPNRFRKAMREWRARNPEKVYAQTSKRRADKLNATPAWVTDSELYSFILDEIYDLAKARTKLMGVEFHVDHIVPLKASASFNNQVACGLHVPWNLQIIPASENQSKNCYSWPDKWDY